MNKGLPIVISAPSGCGKDTILEQLYKKNSNLTQSVSATTRAMREGEIDGVSYHFTTADAFEKMIAMAKCLNIRSIAATITVRLRKPLRICLNRAGT